MANPQASGAELITSIDQKIEKIRSRPLDLSFNELLDMHKNKELIIDPEYQRLFRWSEGKQSRFIETLLLEMPIPPIYVIEIEDGVYELIDGLQRISSYLHFRGKHPDRLNDDGTYHKLTLTECDVAQELNEYTFDSLPTALQIKLKRNFVRVEVIRKESDSRLRYYVFKRLNTGGELLSEQEIRNCTIRLLDNTFNNFIIEEAGNSDFRECISSISEERAEQKGDQELVLRFFAFKNNRQNYMHDVGDFMTEYMEAVSDPAKRDFTFDYPTERLTFEKTFKILNRTLAASAFAGTNIQGTLVTRFLSYHYEAFTLGLQPHLNKIDPYNDIAITKLREVLLSIKKDPTFRNITTGGGKNYPKPLQQRIEFVEKKVGTAF
jgi:Protein of unknown function DUF262